MHSIILKSNISTRQDKSPNQRLSRLTHQWNWEVCHELHNFARRRWATKPFLNLFTLHRYRLRKRLEPEKSSWWVEHDLAPYDRYRCEAFIVVLSLTQTNQPQLIVRSGSASYPVVPLNDEGLKSTLNRIMDDAPLIINRQFGPAIDP